MLRTVSLSARDRRNTPRRVSGRFLALTPAPAPELCQALLDPREVDAEPVSSLVAPNFETGFVYLGLPSMGPEE